MAFTKTTAGKMENPPLIFERRLGGLFPANPAAERAVSNIEGRVRLEIKRTRGNVGRMGLYWVVLAKVAPILSDMCEGDAIDEALLHRILKDRRGLFTETVLPSGEVVKNYDSISFHKMTEPERSEYVSWAFGTMAKWLKISEAELTVP